MTEELATETPSPYRGIHPFRYADRDLFHGRKTLVLDVCSYIQLHRLVVIYGKSGAGKSSLINAGVIPSLEKVGMRSERLRFGTTTEYPLLVQRICPTGSDEGPFLPSIFDPPTNGPTREPRLVLRAGTFLAVARHQTSPTEGSSPAPTVLFFDQFEELFTRFEEGQGEKAEKMRQFQNEMRDAIVELATDSTLRLRLVLIIREDFLGHLESLTRKYPRALDYRMRLRFLSRREAVTSIVAPFGDENSKDGGGTNSFPSLLTSELAQQIALDIACGEQPALSSAEPSEEAQSAGTSEAAASGEEEDDEEAEGIIPPTQVQIVCSELWKSYADTEPSIGVDLYRRKGRVQGILKGYFKREIKEIAPSENLRRATLKILRNLITEAETRDVVAVERLQDLVARDGINEDEVNSSLETLERRRLVNKTSQRGTSYYEVASEYLIPAILKETQKDEVYWARVTAEKKASEEAAVREKEEERRREIERLFTNVQKNQALAESERRRAESERLRAEEQHGRAELEREWGDIKEREARRFRWVAMGALSMALVALVAAGVAFLLFRDSSNKSKLATSSKLAAMSLARIDDHLDLALLLAREAYATSPTAEAKYGLAAALTSDRYLIAFLQASGEPVQALTFSPDGKRIVVASCQSSAEGTSSEEPCSESHVQVWDVSARGPAGPKVVVHMHLGSLEFSPDGNTVAVGGCGKLEEVDFEPVCKSSAMAIWNVSSQAPIVPVERPNFGKILRVRFSVNGKLLASTGEDDKITLWDAASQRVLHTFQDSTPRSKGRSIRSTKQMVTASFSQDGKTLIAVREDRHLAKWDVASGKQTSRGTALEGNEELFEAGLNQNGTILLGVKKPTKADDVDSLVVWDTTTRKRLQDVSASKDARVRAANITADGSTLVMATCQDSTERRTSSRAPRSLGCVEGRIQLWSEEDWEGATRLTGYSGPVNALSFAPKGTLFATGGEDGAVVLWDSAAADRLTTSQPLSGNPLDRFSQRDLAMGEDGSLVVGTCAKRNVDLECSEGGIEVWDPPAKNPSYVLKGHGDAVESVAVSANNKILASGSKDGTILFWDLVGRKTLGPELRQSGWVRSLAFNSDGTLLASAGCKSPHDVGYATKIEVCKDGEVHVWQVNERREIPSPLPPQDGLVAGLAFVSSTKLVYSIRSGILETDVYTPHPVKLPINAGSWPRLAVSRDGSELVALDLRASSINLVRLANNDLIAELPMAGFTTGAALARDGKRMVTIEVGGHANFWDLDPDSWADRACKIANRNLNAEEWRGALRNQPPHRTCPEFPGPLEKAAKPEAYQ